MGEIILKTFDWVPERPRGFVRDLRVRWALEEAGLPYRVEAVSFRDRGAAHFAHQPFGQVPWILDGELSIFETGAILLHLGEQSPALLPRTPVDRATAINWMFAAINSMEMAIMPMLILSFAGDDGTSPGAQRLQAFRAGRLKHLEAVLVTRPWLAGSFSVADILMADALRLVNANTTLADCPACRDYLARATARPAFLKAHADQLAHFAKGDAAQVS
jgi:glutathione S-transferase